MSKKPELEIQSLFRRQLPLVYEKFYATNGIQTFPPHWHRHFEMIRVIRGSFRLTLVNDVIVMKPGDIAFIDSNEAHTGLSLSDDLIYDMLQIKIESIQDYVASFNPLDMLLKKRASVEKVFKDENIYNIFSRVAPIYDLSDSCLEIVFFGYIFELFGFLLSNHSASLDMPAYKDSFIEIIDYINEHNAEKLTVETLAKQFSFHVSYFSHKFKATVGISPNKYILISRLKTAEEYLKKTNLSIDIIAQKCGFESTSYFIKKFKDYTNSTPVKYRRANSLPPPPEFQRRTE